MKRGSLNTKPADLDAQLRSCHQNKHRCTKPTTAQGTHVPSRTSCAVARQASQRQRNMKSTVFSDVTPCSPAEAHTCFGRSSLHLQGRSNQSEPREENYVQIRPVTLRALNLEDGGSAFLRNLGSFDRTTQLRVPEDITFHGHRRESIKSSREMMSCNGLL
jgi:hypothetical protein